MNDENLRVPTSSEARENGRKGGKASAKARKKKADIRKAIQSILDDSYFYAEDGIKMTGEEILATTLFKIATDKKHRQCIQAQRLIYELTGQDKSPEDRKRIKQALKLQEKEIELIQKKIDKDDDW